MNWKTSSEEFCQCGIRGLWLQDNNTIVFGHPELINYQSQFSLVTWSSKYICKMLYNVVFMHLTALPGQDELDVRNRLLVHPFRINLRIAKYLHFQKIKQQN